MIVGIALNCPYIMYARSAENEKVVQIITAIINNSCSNPIKQYQSYRSIDHGVESCQNSIMNAFVDL